MSLPPYGNHYGLLERRPNLNPYKVSILQMDFKRQIGLLAKGVKKVVAHFWVIPVGPPQQSKGIVQEGV